MLGLGGGDVGFDAALSLFEGGANLRPGELAEDG
jgi:hypothetical protein